MKIEIRTSKKVDMTPEDKSDIIWNTLMNEWKFMADKRGNLIIDKENKEDAVTARLDMLYDIAEHHGDLHDVDVYFCTLPDYENFQEIYVLSLKSYNEYIPLFICNSKTDYRIYDFSTDVHSYDDINEEGYLKSMSHNNNDLDCTIFSSKTPNGRYSHEECICGQTPNKRYIYTMTKMTTKITEWETGKTVCERDRSGWYMVDSDVCCVEVELKQGTNEERTSIFQIIDGKRNDIISRTNVYSQLCRSNAETQNDICILIPVETTMADIPIIIYKGIAYDGIFDNNFSKNSQGFVCYKDKYDSVHNLYVDSNELLSISNNIYPGQFLSELEKYGHKAPKIL